MNFTEKSFFYTSLGFIQSHIVSLLDYEVNIRLIPGSYESDKHINNTGIDKNQLNCDCSNGSIVNGLRQRSLYSFGLDKPTGHRICKKRRIKSNF